MLKNKNNTLPLLKGGRLAILGPLSDATELLKGNYAGNAVSITSPLAAFTAKAREVKHAIGSSICDGTAQELRDARDAVKDADAVVLVLGLDGHSLPYSNETAKKCKESCLESESCDRQRLGLPVSQVSLVKTVVEASKPGTSITIVVFGGGALDLSFAEEEPRVGAILWSGYPGESGGIGVASVLFGDSSPSGRLTQSFYKESFTKEVSMEDMKMRPHDASPGRGYRFYTGREMLYPFGHGLSYTKFSYSELSWLESSHELVGRVTNTGAVASSHSVLVFGTPPLAGSHGRPLRKLMGFAKVFLVPGESKELNIDLDQEAFHLADQHGDFHTAHGDWTLSYGGVSERDSTTTHVHV